jgi:tetratricopeptide (TPR) repeat protein
MNQRLEGLDAAATQNATAAGRALDSGSLDEADRLLGQLSSSYARHPEVLRLQAGLLSLRGKHRDAVRLMREALSQRPQDALYQNTLGSLLGTAGDYESAIDALRSACKLQPSLVHAWYNLGVMLTKCVRNDEAVSALQQAIALAPDHMAARALLADMLRTRGDVAEAAAEYRKILAKRPTAGMAWWGLADLKNAQLNAADIESMQHARQLPDAGDSDRIAIGFALAKALDDAGRYDEAMAALQQANAIAQHRQSWDAAAFSNNVRRISGAFDPPVSGSTNPLGREVIFIVSLPRAGSTLVEQILASHPSVEGAGELPDLPVVLAEESRLRGQPFPQWVGEMRAADWERLGQRYLERTARWQKRRPFFTDKLPNNWIYIGAIRAMLPGARIVVCLRDPLETCFSAYRQFMDGNNGYTRSFQSLASFWADFDRSTRDAGFLHPDHVRMHSYEALLTDPEKTIRGLLDFCELPFAEACLNFHENRREVRSPSATQVRQPLQQNVARAYRYGIRSRRRDYRVTHACAGGSLA